MAPKHPAACWLRAQTQMAGLVYRAVLQLISQLMYLFALWRGGYLIHQSPACPLQLTWSILCRPRASATPDILFVRGRPDKAASKAHSIIPDSISQIKEQCMELPPSTSPPDLDCDHQLHYRAQFILQLFRETDWSVGHGTVFNSEVTCSQG